MLLSECVRNVIRTLWNRKLLKLRIGFNEWLRLNLLTIKTLLNSMALAAA
jgi:hypothetical protein